ncbi:MAG: EF-P lysine aminoacylase EpmA [Candidatus Magasanikbacteria bacterium]|jgi:lysyl-tRNA synthetase class 2
MSNFSELKNNPRLKEIYEQRLQILRFTREFFWSQNFVEAETPIALHLPGQEPYLNPMPVEFVDPQKVSYKFYLRTSPEYALKKLLAVGYQKVFEIGKCFRNEESFGGTHNPEFTMIEWYRAPGTYLDFMDDTENLFKYVGQKLKVEKLKYRNLEIEYLNTWDRLSVKDLWQKYLQVNLDDYLSVESMRKLVQANGLAVEVKDEYEDLFYKLFLNKIEPNLGIDRPIFICDYPAQMCSLSKLCEHDPRYAQRAELYIGGLELANGFGELTDSKMQRFNLEKDQALRGQLGKEVWPIDEDFIKALDSLKPAFAEASARQGGIALGVDRMVVLFTEARDIDEVIFQSVADQLGN